MKILLKMRKSEKTGDNRQPTLKADAVGRNECGTTAREEFNAYENRCGASLSESGTFA